MATWDWFFYVYAINFTCLTTNSLQRSVLSDNLKKGSMGTLSCFDVFFLPVPWSVRQKTGNSTWWHLSKYNVYLSCPCSDFNKTVSSESLLQALQILFGSAFTSADNSWAKIAANYLLVYSLSLLPAARLRFLIFTKCIKSTANSF